METSQTTPELRTIQNIRHVKIKDETQHFIEFDDGTTHQIPAEMVRVIDDNVRLTKERKNGFIADSRLQLKLSNMEERLKGLYKRRKLRPELFVAQATQIILSLPEPQIAVYATDRYLAKSGEIVVKAVAKASVMLAQEIENELRRLLVPDDRKTYYFREAEETFTFTIMASNPAKNFMCIVLNGEEKNVTYEWFLKNAAESEMGAIGKAVDAGKEEAAY